MPKPRSRKSSPCPCFQPWTSMILTMSLPPCGKFWTTTVGDRSTTTRPASSMSTTEIPKELRALVDAYESAPPEFHATAYWESYSKEILDTIATMDIRDIHSGKYPIL